MMAKDRDQDQEDATLLITVFVSCSEANVDGVAVADGVTVSVPADAKIGTVASVLRRKLGVEHATELGLLTASGRALGPDLMTLVDARLRSGDSVRLAPTIPIHVDTKLAPFAGNIAVSADRRAGWVLEDLSGTLALPRIGADGPPPRLALERQGFVLPESFMLADLDLGEYDRVELISLTTWYADLGVADGVDVHIVNASQRLVDIRLRVVGNVSRCPITRSVTLPVPSAATLGALTRAIQGFLHLQRDDRGYEFGLLSSTGSALGRSGTRVDALDIDDGAIVEFAPTTRVMLRHQCDPDGDTIAVSVDRSAATVLDELETVLRLTKRTTDGRRVRRMLKASERFGDGCETYEGAVPLADQRTKERSDNPVWGLDPIDAIELVTEVEPRGDQIVATVVDALGQVDLLVQRDTLLSDGLLLDPMWPTWACDLAEFARKCVRSGRLRGR